LSAGVAQLVEQLIRNQQAGGSNPPAGSIIEAGGLIWPDFIQKD
jgi:hypothetical protein